MKCISVETSHFSIFSLKQLLQFDKRGQWDFFKLSDLREIHSGVSPRNTLLFEKNWSTVYIPKLQRVPIIENPLIKKINFILKLQNLS